MTNQPDIQTLSPEQLGFVSGGYPGQGLVNKVKDGASNVHSAVDNVIGKVPGGRLVAKKIPIAGTAYGAFSAGKEWSQRSGESTFDRLRHSAGAFLL
ncbi:MAG TPA: hypothetical protein VIV11_32505 [Kofleriaceae bacterium]